MQPKWKWKLNIAFAISTLWQTIVGLDLEKYLRDERRLDLRLDFHNNLQDGINEVVVQVKVVLEDLLLEAYLSM